mgnify:CR=1 FL=1
MRVDRAQREGRRRALAGIDEKRGAPILQIQRMLDLELEILDQLERVSQPFFVQPHLQASEQQRPEGIVATAGVAAGEHDERRDAQLRLRLCTSVPSGSRSSTVSGILPSACVAQDRHGS